MAVMTSSYWTSMSAGRVVWAVASSFIKSAWPVLLLNIALCSIGSVLFCSTSEGALLAAALSLGVGVSSIFPALVSLPGELRVEMTPRRLAVLQLMASAGALMEAQPSGCGRERGHRPSALQARCFARSLSASSSRCACTRRLGRRSPGCRPSPSLRSPRPSSSFERRSQATGRFGPLMLCFIESVRARAPWRARERSGV
mmetsp:Transcript_34590/g.111109  ORF Transcript_34590/g.111109 Transcript_34590/m.111109 type:complete len:200 (+) Transcript_34590:1237-1836(+)